MQMLRPANYEETTGKVIFLAGCTPRDNSPSWRPEAIQLFEQLGFQGTLIAPEPFCNDYAAQVEWESYYLHHADIILFWLPRNMKTGMYGLTSNVEFGIHLHGGKIIYGRPDGSDNNRYLDYCYRKFYQQDPYDELEQLVAAAFKKV